MGRRFRQMDMAEVIEGVGKVETGTRLFCRDCPKHSHVGHWCCVMAKTVVPNASACKYGIIVIRAARLDASRKGIKRPSECDNNLEVKQPKKGKSR